MEKGNTNHDACFTAAIMEIDDVASTEHENLFKNVIGEITDKIGYNMVKVLEIPYDAYSVKRKVADLIDEENIGLVFVRNRGRYSLNEELFDLEDREFRECKNWKRIWSRQRILYNTFNHAITVVRGDSLIMNFEGEFTGVSDELVEILEMWKENCILYKKDDSE